MNKNNNAIDTLQDIKRMMEHSSRFISLSGWSGISAGICALVGGYFAHYYLKTQGYTNRAASNIWGDGSTFSLSYLLSNPLFQIAILTLIAAIALAFFFTYRNSKKQGVPIWTASSRKLVESMSVPLVAGGLVSLFIAYQGLLGLIAPMLLIFYGIALTNAAKYTLTETKWLGYIQIGLGLVNLLFIGYGLYFWIFGFGIMHILYGLIMWNKYERYSIDA